MTRTVLPRSGAPLADHLDDATRDQLTALRDGLAKREALARPRGEGGRFAEVPRDQLVRDNKTLQRMRDVTAAAGDRTIGQLLDAANVPSVTQLTRRYSTQASRAPLLGMLVGKSFGPGEAAVLGTTPALGRGGALVPYEPKPVVVYGAPFTQDARFAEDVAQAARSQRSEEPRAAEEAPPKGLWDSLKSFGRMVLGEANKVWSKLKTHALVAPVLSFFAGRGFGPAEASVAGAHPPRGAAAGAPLHEADASTPPAPDFVAPTPQTLGRAVRALSDAWPRGVDAEPPAFTRQSEALQTYKQERLQGLDASPKLGDVQSLLSEADAIHGKPGHSENLAALADGFLADPAVQTALAGIDGFTRGTASQVRSFAPLLSLGDLEAPVSLFAAPRRPTDDEFRDHIATRGPRAGAMVRALNLGPERAAQLLTEFKSDAPTHFGSRLIRLFDDTAALAAKPFCRTDDGAKVNVDVLADKLTANARPEARPLAELMIDFARRGGVDAAIDTTRGRDLYQF